MTAIRKCSHGAFRRQLAGLAASGVFLAALLGGCPASSSAPAVPDTTGTSEPNTATPATSTPGGGTNVTPGTGGGQSTTTPPTTPPSYTLQAVVTGQGTVDPPSGTFQAGTSVTLTATAATGWRFEHWEGGVSGTDNPVTITIQNADLQVTAVFVPIAGAPLGFYAVYDWVIDDERLGTGIDKLALSSDASKLFFANGDGSNGHRKAYSMNPDGSGLVTYNLPNAGPYGTSAVVYLVVNRDGTRAFAAPLYDNAIFKLENGGVTTLSVDRPQGPNGVMDLGTNAAGTLLCFRDVSKIWRVDHTGAGLQMVAEDRTIPARGGRGEALGDMAVAADGTTVAFIMYVRNAQNSSLSNEIFCLHGGAVTQLTDDRKGISSKGTGIAISGDGSTIVYMDGVQRKYIAIGADGTNARAIAPIGGNAVYRCLTYDGRKMIWYDGTTDGGRMINTDGTGAFDLLPGSNVMTMTIAMSGPISISADGNHIAFRHEYAQWPFKRCIYVGHLNDANAVAAAPRIESIAFSPAAMPRGDPNAQVLLLARVSDADADIRATQAWSLVNGALEGNSANVPVHYYFSPLDDGHAPDVVAGDGIYTSVGRPGGKINDFSQAVIRLAVRDAKNRITIADAPLAVGP